MNKLVIATLASSLLLFTGSIAGAQTARARIADTPVRAEANLASAIIATLKEGGPVDVVDLQDDWYRVLLPNEQGKPRVGYVLANLIEILNANGSPQSITTPPTRSAERPMAQGQPIPPTRVQLARERAKVTEREIARVELEAARAELDALQADPLTISPRASAQPIRRAGPTAKVSSPAAAQVADLSPSARRVKSASAKFFLGGDFEGTGIVTTQPNSDSYTESGAGLGLVLGYGFTPIWAVYGNLSGANMSDLDGNSFGLSHVDIGVRAHFLTGPHVVVPFVQGGLSRRGEAQTFTTRTAQHDVTASGTGGSFGGGLNIHVRPALAISCGLTWSVGKFTHYTVDTQTVPVTSVSATSARVHVGIIWFPKTPWAKS
jgi:hypothetical protein